VAYRFDEIVHHGIHDQIGWSARYLHRAVARAHEDASRTYVLRQPDIQPAIAHRERARGIDRQLPYGAIHETASRLSALARADVRRHVSVRVVRTIVIRVEVGASLGQQAGQMPVNSGDGGLVEEASRDPGLVRDEDRAKPGAIQRANGVVNGYKVTRSGRSR